MDDNMYQRIRALCKERGITIRALEKQLGFPESYINKMGKTNRPSIDSVAKVANFFGVSIDYIYGNSEIRSTADDVFQDETIISLQRACEKMSEEDKSKSLQMLRIAFDYAFSE